MNWERYILLLHKKLSGQISPEEIRILDDWRSQSPVHEEFLNEIEELWTSSANYLPDINPDVSKAKEAFFEKINAQSKTTQVYTLKPEAKILRFRAFSLAIAASLILILGSLFVYRNFIYDPIPGFMNTGEPLVKADSRSADHMTELADGTKLWLKPGSHFMVANDFNNEDREVYLHGEMFVNVAKDVTRPFVIHMESNTLRVLGTAFYLKSDDSDAVILDLVEGNVSISDNDDQIKEVVEGTTLKYDKTTGDFSLENDQNPLVTDWRKKYLIFDNVPLVNVFARLSVYYGVQFRIECKKIEEMAGYTSLVQPKDDTKIEGFLKSIRKVYGIQIDQTGQKTYRVHGGPCK
jgi:ferric-dicitrate binding protein FerR (iron transport regulator)